MPVITMVSVTVSVTVSVKTSVKREGSVTVSIRTQAKRASDDPDVSLRLPSSSSIMCGARGILQVDG